MLLGLTDVTIIFGIRGSGKSTLSRQLSSAYPRRVVVDPLSEWTGDSPDTRIVVGFEAFAQAYADLFSRDRWTLVYQFDPETSDEDQRAEFNAVLRSLYFSGRQSGVGACVVIEEVHTFATPHTMEHWLRQIVLTGRHAHLAVVASTQRPASVNKALVSQAAHVFTGQLFESRDVKYLEETLSSDIAARAAMLPKFTFIGFTPGQATVEVQVFPD